MAKRSHEIAAWLFDVPLRSKLLHKVARAYCSVYKNGRVDRCDIHTNGELRFIQRVAPELSTVFDVGANVGDWTAELLAANSAAKCHCFEPVPGTRAKLEARGMKGDVTINPFGLSSEPGSFTLYNYGDGSGLNSLYRREDLEAKNKNLKPTVIEIPLETLDGYAERNGIEQIDLLKIDVEGHELSVLRGATRMLAEGRIRMIQMEYGSGFQLANALLRDIFDVVAPAGMTGGRITPEGVEKNDGYHARLEDFRLSNWAFARPDDEIVWQ